MINRKWIIVVAGLAVVLMVIGGSLMPVNSATNPPDDVPAMLAPDFTLKDIDGKPYTLSNLRGSVVVINFWATWCAPCRVEIPDLSRIYTNYKDQDLVILGVSLDEAGTDQVRKFAANYKMTYPVLHGTRTELARVNELYGPITAIPTTFIIDREGYIHTAFLGSRDEKFFLDYLIPLLAKESVLPL